MVKLLGVKVFPMTEVDRLGIARVMEETCDHLCESVYRLTKDAICIYSFNFEIDQSLVGFLL